MPLTQAELGEWIGTIRETVERVLARWVKRGAVRARWRSLLILDIAFLSSDQVVEKDSRAADNSATDKCSGRDRAMGQVGQYSGGPACSECQ